MNGDLLDLCHSISSCKSLRRSETSVPDLGSGGIRRARWISELSALDLVLDIAGGVLIRQVESKLGRWSPN